jgi:transcriptional regulator with XRE-family HTH domain
MQVAAIETAQRFRERLRNERIRRRCSQSDLATRVGRSRKWLSDFERGLIEPSFVVVIALAKELNISIEFISSDAE